MTIDRSTRSKASKPDGCDNKHLGLGIMVKFDLKKSKGQIGQWRVMDFLNSYSQNLHLPWMR